MFSVLLSSAAVAQPVGTWWSAFGQGTYEYGIRNDSAGSDAIYIACSDDSTDFGFTVGGKQAPAGEVVIATIGANEFELSIDESGNVDSGSRVDSDTFDALWRAMRTGQSMRVRYPTGPSTAFSLKGASKALPTEACTTDFAR